MDAVSYKPLTHRLTGIFLMCGVSCLVLTVGALHFLRDSSPIGFTACVIMLPLLFLVLGSRALRKTLEQTSEIEKRLSGFASNPNGTGDELLPIPGSQLAVSGWNHLVERVTKHQSLASLEEKLSKSLVGLNSKKSDTVLNSLQDGVAVSNSKGQITFANRSFYTLLRLEDGKQALGARLEDLLPLNSDSEKETLSEQLQERSHSMVFELEIGEDDETNILRIARQLLCNEGGQTADFIWTIRDITQQKLADEMRNDFVYSATHELRTPLANIKAYAETLALNDDIDVEQQKEFCNTINSEATRLARFVEELLNISQMEAGALSIARHEIDVSRLVEEVCQMVQPQINSKDMKFDSNIPPKLHKLNIDKDKIISALVNLLGNAVKYTPEGGHVTFTVEETDGNILFHVEDNGFGISEEELPKVFEKFFRSSEARVGDVAGSGLGLSFTQEVARLHGGKITVKSELNKGSQFTMSLPIA